MARVKRRSSKRIGVASTNFRKKHVWNYGGNMGKAKITFRCGHSYMTDSCSTAEEVRKLRRDMITGLCNDCWKDRWRYLTTNILSTSFRITDVMDYIDTIPAEIEQMMRGQRTIDDVGIIK